MLEINRTALQLAREVAGDELLVAGDLSQTWLWSPGDGAAEKAVATAFDEQIEASKGSTSGSARRSSSSAKRSPVCAGSRPTASGRQ